MTIRFRSIVALIGVAILAAMPATAMSAEGASADDIRLDKPPPGKFVRVGRINLYIYCKGHGEPTVVFDSGIGGGSLEWLKVQLEGPGSEID